MMKNKYKHETDTIKDFIRFLKERDITMIKTINSKSYNKTDYKGDNERTIINFQLEMKNVSKKDIERELKLFILENFEI